ncbi:MAG: hypothetical protein Q4F54_01830 [Coriobacteriia bacterium]|nr:hypothetical protein [Coriobacteriia bacterium]
MNQVFKYQDIIKKSNKYVNEDNVNVYSCAYLHNIQNKNIDWIRNKVPAGNMSKLFFCGEGNDMKQ